VLNLLQRIYYYQATFQKEDDKYKVSKGRRMSYELFLISNFTGKCRLRSKPDQMGIFIMPVTQQHQILPGIGGLYRIQSRGKMLDTYTV
jgi:hypothetical protein